MPTVKTITQLQTDIVAQIFENTSEQVTATNVQNILVNMASSYYNRLDNIILDLNKKIYDSTQLSEIILDNQAYQWTNDAGGYSDAFIACATDHFEMGNTHAYVAYSNSGDVMTFNGGGGLLQFSTTVGIGAGVRGIQANASLMYLYHGSKLDFDSPIYNFAQATASRVAVFDASKNLVGADTIIYPSLTEFSYVKGVTSSIQTQLNSKLNLAGGTMTGTLVLNADATTGLQAVTYQQLVSTVTDGVFDLQQGYDASTNLFPVASQTNPVVSSIKKGFVWYVTVGGTLPGSQVVEPGDTITALVDNPGTTVGNWLILEHNFGFTPISNVLNSGKILVGSNANIATAVSMAGDATMDNVGNITIASIGGKSVTLAGSFQTAGAYSLGFTMTNNTALVLPITGTLATLAGSEAFTNKTGNISMWTNDSGYLTNTTGDVRYLQLSGGTMTGNLILNGDATTNLQAVTLQQLNNAILGTDYKQACKYVAITTLPTYVYANGSSGVGATITGVAFGAITFDGVTPSVGDRVLVPNETGTNQPYNGSYTVTTVGGVATLYVLTRSTDFDQSADITSGDAFFISGGNTKAASTYVYNGITAPTVGTTNLTFTQTQGAGVYSAGAGITLSSNTFSISASAITNSMLAGSITYSKLSLSNSILYSDLASMTSANLLSKISDATGSGFNVFATSPTLITPILGVASATSIALTGTGGNGFATFLTQSSQPTYGASGFVIYANALGKFAWINQADTYERSLSATLTANRIYTLQDSSDTFVMRATTDTLTNKTINGSNNTVSNMLNEVAEASSTPVVANAEGTIQNTQCFAYYTLPTTEKWYIITGIEWLNGATVNGNVFCGVSIVDANPPTVADVSLVAWGNRLAQSGTNSVQRNSLISSVPIRGGTLIGVWINSGSATGTFQHITGQSSQNQTKSITAAAPATIDSTAWNTATIRKSIKVYYRGIN